MTRSRVLVFSLYASVAAAACSSDDGTAPASRVASVKFPLDSLASVPGAVLPLRVVVRDSANAPLTGEPVHWTSLDTAVATVDSTGKITAKTTGATRIIATSGVHADTLRVRFDVVLYSSVSVGDYHACGVASPSGAVYCWGFGGQGELGIGDTMTVDAPVKVLSNEPFGVVGAGFRHTCGLTITGIVYCWGMNDIGQGGIGARDTVLHLVPQLVSGNGYLDLSVGDFHSCALNGTGTASCWGYGHFGEIGTGDTLTVNPTPVPVVGALQFSTVSAGQVHTCGIATDSIGYCWGESSRLGSTCATSLCYASPQPISGGLKMIRVSASEAHTCALANDGKAWCWGSNDTRQLGVSRDTSWSDTPVSVHGGLVFDRITAGTYHSCAWTAAGAASCWGAGGGGQLGDGTLVDSSEPLVVAGNLEFASISAATNYSCGITRHAVVYCWGTDQSHVGVLGTGDADQVSVHATPTKILGQQ